MGMDKTRQAHPSENSPMYVGPRAPKVPVVEVREFSVVPIALPAWFWPKFDARPACFEEAYPHEYYAHLVSRGRP